VREAARGLTRPGKMVTGKEKNYNKTLALKTKKKMKSQADSEKREKIGKSTLKER